MGKVLLLSVIVAMIGFPVSAARNKSARTGLKRMLFLMIAFNVFYLLAVRYVYPHLN